MKREAEEDWGGDMRAQPLFLKGPKLSQLKPRGQQADAAPRGERFCKRQKSETQARLEFRVLAPGR